MKLKITGLIILVVIIFSLFTNCFNTADVTTEDGAIPDNLTVKDALVLLGENQLETITNLDNPKIEEIIFDKEPSIYLIDESTKLKGKTVVKYTYNTTQDGLLGPITFYVDKKTGIVLGSDYRE